MVEQVNGKTIEIRPANQGDREAVAAISAQIWDGDGYVPRVFDKWVADTMGEFSLVCVDGQVAGFGKLTMLSAEDAWLEGLRMGKGHRGLGLAKSLTKYYVNICRERGVNSLRLSTFVENHESLHIIETHGFQRVASFKLLTAQAREGVASPAGVVAVASLEELEQFVDAELLARRGGLLSFDFTFEPWRDSLLRDLISERSIFALRRNGQAVGLLILSARHSKSGELSISYMQGETPIDLATLTDFALATAGREQRNLIVMCPEDDLLLSVYLQKGLVKECGNNLPDVFVYEHESTLRRA